MIRKQPYRCYRLGCVYDALFYDAMSVMSLTSLLAVCQLALRGGISFRIEDDFQDMIRGFNT